MTKRAPAPRDQRPPLPAFEPVPRKCRRHDGWTPDRQRAFIGALADTGCVKVACRMVNIAVASAYHLRREPGAEGFRHAWDAVLDFRLQVLKDEAFERAMHGELVPVFSGGRLMGFRRQKNDRLLMFVLRHYGQDSEGRRVSINYFSSRATAGAAAAANDPPSASAAAAEASTTTVRTTISSSGRERCAARQDDAAAALLAFEGVELDEQAKAEILRVIEAAAERRRACHPDSVSPGESPYLQEEDEECDFIRVGPDEFPYVGQIESGYENDEFVPFVEGEAPWQSIGAPVPDWYSQWEADQAAKAAALPAPDEAPRPREEPGEGPSRAKSKERPARREAPAERTRPTSRDQLP